ncbi:MAG: peptide chain release factor-like protein, partial [Chloroflexi bacterium]|nr:peptide chain release factor-like protein [Chloroflexota bacterium]
MAAGDDAGVDREGDPGYSSADLERLQREVIVEAYRAPGPGGQRKNRKETAVRLKHIPTGVTVVASERRSQAMNREVAFRRLQ